MDEEQFFLATDGENVPIPPLQQLPDESFDPTPYRSRVIQNAAFADGIYYRWLHEACQSELRYFQFRKAEGASKGRPPAQPRTIKAIEAEVEKAGKRRSKLRDSNVDDLLSCFASAEAASDFHSKISRFFGHNFIEFGDSGFPLVRTYAPWLAPLFAELPPAVLAPAVRSIRYPALFNKHHKGFHEPAVAAFLAGPHGDLRHLENPCGERHRFSNVDLSLREFVDIRSQGANASTVDRGPFAFLIGSVWLDLRDHAGLIETHLGLRLDMADLAQADGCLLAVIRRLQGMLTAGETSHRGQFLSLFMAFPKESGLGKLDRALVWPYVAANLQVIDEVLLAPGDAKGKLPKITRGALLALDFLPKVPKKYLEAIQRVSNVGNKYEKEAAQKLLDRA